MPRIHLWFSGAAVATAAGYASYYYVYVPRTTSQLQFESRLMVENQQLQGVQQSYARLRDDVESARARATRLALQQSPRLKEQLLLLASPSSAPASRARGSAISGGATDAQAERCDGEEVGVVDEEAARRSSEYAEFTASTPTERASTRTPADGDTSAGPSAADLSAQLQRLTDALAFPTNQGKLLLFLRIQRLRWMLLRLPTTAQLSMRNETGIFDELDDYERRYCCSCSQLPPPRAGAGGLDQQNTDRHMSRAAAGAETGAGLVVHSTSPARDSFPGAARSPARSQPSPAVCVDNGLLNFREKPLVWTEKLSCAICFLLYLVFLRVVPAVVEALPVAVARLVVLSSDDRRACSRHALSDRARERQLVECAVHHRMCLLRHVVATGIMHSLDVDAVLVRTASDDDGAGERISRPAPPPSPSSSPPATAAREGHYPEEEGVKAIDGAPQESASVEAAATRFVVFNPSHWIEEVGLWACAGSPLLGSSPLLPRTQLLSAPRTAPLLTTLDRRSSEWWQASTRYPRTHAQALLDVVYACIAGRAARAFPMDLTVYWQREQHRRVERERREAHRLRRATEALRGRAPINAEEGREEEEAGEPVERARSDRVLSSGLSSLGYPYAVDAVALRRYALTDARAVSGASAADAEQSSIAREVAETAAELAAPPRFAPVAVAGLPRLLYVNESVARVDEQRRSSADDAYALVAREQFRDAHHDRRTRDAPHAVDAAAADSASRQRSWTAHALTALQQHRGTATSHLLWDARLQWFGVYGGASPAGPSQRRVLRYQLGRLSYASEVTPELIDACEKAVLAAYADGGGDRAGR